MTEITPKSNWIILKFGGSSVSEASHWQTIAQVVQQQLNAGFRPMLVLSALKNVSNLLEALLHQSISGVHPIAIEHLKEMHQGLISQLKLPVDILLSQFKNLEAICHEIHQSQQITPRNHAAVVSHGELFSTTIGLYFLNQHQISTDWLDARQTLLSIQQADSWHHYTSAYCNFEYSPQLRNQLEQLNQVIITQGFIAADIDGNTVLLGREGSDTSAAYFGAKLNAAEVQIWTDVPGVFSANPKEVPQARQLPKLTYQQAHTMAQLGAKVLHPRALEPAMSNTIPIQVKCTHLPQNKGTRISVMDIAKDEKESEQIIAVTTEPQITWIRLPQTQNMDIDLFIEKVTAIGFDLILKCQKNENYHLIFVYKNSDQAQLTDEALFEYLSVDDIRIKSELSLISLINISNQGEWVNKITQFVQQLLPNGLLEALDLSLRGHLSLIVSPQNKLCQQLHFHLIENRLDNSLFGENWEDLQS